MKQRSIIATAAAALLATGVLAVVPAAADAMVPRPAAAGATAPGPAALMIGVHPAGSFAAAESALGPMNSARYYYTGALPVSFQAPSASLPAGVVPVISYNTPTTNVVSFVRSVHRLIWLAYRHEPEDGHQFASGAAYVSQFEAQSRLIRSVHNPLVKVVTINAGYAYRSHGGLGLGGSYLPPASYVDAYLLDLYQTCCTGDDWPSQGLANYDRFQNWLKLVGGRGRPLGLGEYGIAAADSVRDARLQADAAYLRAAFGGKFGVWDYFWVRKFQFTDAATVAAWRAIAASP